MHRLLLVKRWTVPNQFRIVKGRRSHHEIERRVAVVVHHVRFALLYRGVNKGLFVLLSRTQAEPGRTVKQEQEEVSRNHVQTFIYLSVLGYFDPPKIC